MKVDNNFKTKMLNWANQFNIFCFLDNNNFEFETPQFDCLLAVGNKRAYHFTGINDFENLQEFYQIKPSWLFGHFGYNAASNAYSKNNEDNEFGKGFLFEPTHLLKISNGILSLIKSDIDLDTLINLINLTKVESITTKKVTPVPFISKAQYLNDIEQIKQHIKKGDCYEINYCQKFIASNSVINPVETYEKLAAFSPAPFGAFYKLNNNYCICASPERYLKKQGETLISQPIKGTTRRSADKKIDEANKQHLFTSEKERSENVMIVDLVRNDLSIVSKKNSVEVTELFGIYSFPQVHQMISTIQSKLNEDIHFLQAIKACYPMGSMTGAPKKKVMELIEKFEAMERGLFSGSIGYITPDADFDFNVVIRSIFYNKLKREVSLFAGSGITFYADALSEYDECLAKAEALIKVLC